MGSLIEWAKLTWPEAEKIVNQYPFAMLPVGAIEEHGPHMTLETDCCAASKFASLLAERTDAILLPTMPYGQVWSLKNYPGSLTLKNKTLIAVIVDICKSLEEKGFKGVIAVTGHLGNLNSMKIAARELAKENAIPLLHLFYPGLDEISGKVCQSKRAHPSIIHADEIETSLLLKLAPECVNMNKATTEYPTFPKDFDYKAETWEKFSKSGIFGDASIASKEKGEEMLGFVMDKSVSIIKAFEFSILGA